MLYIYSENISPRLEYVVEVLFEDILDVPITLTNDFEQLGKVPSLNYSNRSLEGVPYIHPHGLLFEGGIRTQAEKLNSEGILFPCESDVAEQDILAASFFMLSRYEEYLDVDRDQMGRMKASASMMHQAGLLERPLVDEWAIALFHALRRRYPLLSPLSRKFTVLPTFDIDVAYCYKGRGWWRRTRSTLKDLSTFQWSRLKERKAVLNEERPDNFDSYSYQERICSQANAQSRHFFLLGDYGKYDKNLSHKQQILRDLINEVGQWSQVGIHPSIGSHASERKLKKEIKRLKQITGKEVTRSRQHFLHFELPITFRRLIKAGITEDHSMGYADHIGFRAGTCSPFRWYDLEAEQSTALYLIPIMAMDSTLKDYMALSIEEAKDRVKNLRQAIQEVNGTFVILWHNHSAARQGEWVGWRAVLETGLFG
jgi:hypothetical protein